MSQINLTPIFSDSTKCSTRRYFPRDLLDKIIANYMIGIIQIFNNIKLIILYRLCVNIQSLVAQYCQFTNKIHHN